MMMMMMMMVVVVVVYACLLGLPIYYITCSAL